MGILRSVPRGGTVYVRDTVPTADLVSVLPELDTRGVNVRIVAAISPQLFARQAAEYQVSVTGPAGQLDAMVITNGAYKLMADWASGPLVREYSLSADWDDRWRTGGSVAEVTEEAHLNQERILEAIECFAAERARPTASAQNPARRRITAQAADPGAQRPAHTRPCGR